MENNEAHSEIALLGTILINQQLFHNIKGLLVADDFFDCKNQLIYSTLNKMYDKGFEDVELPLIISELKNQNILEKVGGENYLSFLLDQAGLPSNAQKYVKEISEKADLRRVKDKLTDILKKVERNPNNLTALDIMDKVEQDLFEIIRGNKSKEFINSEQGVAKAIKALEIRASKDEMSGISIGLPSIDNLTSGFQKGDLIILAARPSMGKTALALNMAMNASIDHTVAFFSLEMPTVQLYNRIISSKAFVDANKLRDSSKLNQKDWNKIYLVQDKIKKMNLYIDDTAGIRLSDLVWKAKKLHKNKKVDLIVIDYLQLIVASNNSGDNRQAEVSTISRTLKKLARDLDVPVIALSQLSRKVEQRESKVPMMSDLRESGAIEQDADLITFLYRDAYYNKNKEKESIGNDYTDIIIAKHRNGATGSARLFFKPEHGLFLELGKGK